jgi:ubiquinone/menaquinone biosynthesis C-methylase UbiE
MAVTLLDASYRAHKTGFALFSGLFMDVFHRLIGRDTIPPAAQRAALQGRFRALLDRDLAGAKAGYYPEKLLFRIGFRDAMRVLPMGVFEIPRVVWRARHHAHGDLPPLAQPERYPKYYRRTFHWQSDGWFSEQSARLYDPGVDLLFGGTADIMRRTLIPDLVDALRPLESPRVLDIACGTGRFLDQLHEALPRARLFGLDLSAPYLKVARERLAHVSELSLVAENAEDMPFADNAFDAVSCIFLFHELPSDARRNVLSEAFRVLKPGGLFAVLDSAQADDGADIGGFLEAFPRLYHEPYYKGYSQDPLPEALAAVGFAIVSDERAFVSRKVIAQKPVGAP